jgi:hypothetical protein
MKHLLRTTAATLAAVAAISTAPLPSAAASAQTAPDAAAVTFPLIARSGSSWAYVSGWLGNVRLAESEELARSSARTVTAEPAGALADGTATFNLKPNTTNCLVADTAPARSYLTANVAPDSPRCDDDAARWYRTDSGNLVTVDGHYLRSGLHFTSSGAQYFVVSEHEPSTPPFEELPGSLTPVTATPTFAATVTTPVSVDGTAEPGADIEIHRGQQTIARATADAQGSWSTTVPAPNAPGVAELVAVQRVEGKDVGRATFRVDYGPGVSVATPGGGHTFDPSTGRLSVSGTAQDHAAVRVFEKGTSSKTLGQAVADTDGSYTVDLTGLAEHEYSLFVQSTSKGNNRTAAQVTATPSAAPVVAADLAVASHVKGGTFVPGPQTFTGSATPGATVQMNPFGFTNPNFASYTLTTTADQFGSWTINRGLSDTPYPNISFKQTPHNGVVNELPNYDLKPYKEIGQPGDLTLTNFTAGDYFNPGDQIFTGTATPGATVTLNPFGFDPKYAAYDITTTADTTTGTWQIRRGLADVLYAKLAVKQDPEADGKVNRIEDITVAGNGWTNGTPADLVLTSTDTTFTPGVVTFTGTATPGKTITMFPFGDGQYAHIKDTVKANAIGKWEIKRTLSNQPYPAVFTQDTQNGKVNRITHTITPTK